MLYKINIIEELREHGGGIGDKNKYFLIGKSKT